MFIKREDNCCLEGVSKKHFLLLLVSAPRTETTTIEGLGDKDKKEL